MTQLSSRVAIVTGGNAGIGRSIAMLFAAKGASVVIADRTGEPSTADEITAGGGQALFVRTDVASAADVSGVVAAAVERFGRIDVLVNNAATYVSSRCGDHAGGVGAGLRGQRHRGVPAAAGPRSRRCSTQDARAGVRGRIVNISRQHGMIAAPKRHRLRHLQERGRLHDAPDRDRLRRAGIVCNAVAPGKIMTGKGGPRGRSGVGRPRQAARRAAARRARRRRAGRAVAGLGQASYITGTTSWSTAAGARTSAPSRDSALVPRPLESRGSSARAGPRPSTPTRYRRSAGPRSQASSTWTRAAPPSSRRGRAPRWSRPRRSSSSSPGWTRSSSRRRRDRAATPRSPRQRPASRSSSRSRSPARSRMRSRSCVPRNAPARCARSGTSGGRLQPSMRSAARSTGQPSRS